MTATAVGGVAEATLANKKQFGQVLVAQDEARSIADKIRSAPRALAAFLRSALKAFRLDALAGVIGSAARSAYDAVTGRAKWLYGQVGAILGWNNVAIYAVTDGQTRNRVLDTAAKVYHFAKAPFRLLGRLVSKVPFGGAAAVDFVDSMYGGFELFVAGNITKGRDWLDNNDNHAAFRWARGTVKWAMVGRVIRRFVPSNLRTFAWIAYFFGAWGKPTAAAVRRVQSEPVVSVVKGHFSSAVAKSQDAVVDRVLDGKVNGAQPGTEQAMMLVVGTNEIVDVTVEVDSRGDKRVFWEGAYYDLVDLGQAAKDPLRPISEADAAKLREVRFAQEAAVLAEAEGDSPVPLPNRAAKRAYPAKKQTAGKRH